MSNTGYPFYKAWKANGTSPASGYYLYTYESGTTTPKVTYTDSALLVPNSNPIVLNSNGEATIFLGSGAYRFDLKTPAGSLVNTFDPIQGTGIAVDSVDSIAELRALSPQGDGAFIEVLGYYTAGDGGGGTFYYDASSSAVDDSGMIIRPGSLPALGRWKRNLIGPLDILYYGAQKGNIVAADNAVQGAINYASINAIGTVRVPNGNYKLSGSITLKSDVSIMGEPEAYFQASANNQKMFITTTQTSRFKMFRIGLLNSGAFTGVVGIEAVGTRHVVVYEEMYFENLATGIRLKQLCWDTTVRNCLANGCGVGYEVTDSSHQAMFDRCTSLDATDTGFWAHAEVTDIEGTLFKPMFLQCLSQGATNYGFKLKACGHSQIIGGYTEANDIADIYADACQYFVLEAHYGGSNFGQVHLKMRNCDGAYLHDVCCPGIRTGAPTDPGYPNTSWTFDVDATNGYCEGNIARGASNNLISGILTGLHLQENTNGTLRIGNVGHNSTKIYGVIDTISSAARHYHSMTNHRNDKNDVASTNIIDCRSAYDVWRKGVRGGEFITFTNPEDGQHIFIILRGASDMGDRPQPITIAGYKINMSGAAADQNTVIAMAYDSNYGWIVLSDTGWNQYESRTSDAEGLRLRSGSSIPATGTYKKGDIAHNSAITPTNGIHGWKCVTSGTFSAYSQTCGSVNGSPLLTSIVTTGLHVGDFLSMTAGFPALTVAQVLGLRTNGSANEGAGVSTNGSAVVTGLVDTSDFTIGDFATISAGFPSTVIPYKIIAKTSSTLTFSLNATSSQTGITIQAVAGVELDTNANATVASPGITASTPDPVFERFGRILDKDFSVSYAQAAGTNEIIVENTDTTNTANAKLHAKVTGDGGGNPSVHLEVPGFGSLSLGIDNALANNPGVLAYAGILTSGMLGYFYPAANGGVQWKVRNQSAKQAATVASATDITLGTDGDFVQLTGTTTVNRIATANWQAGAVIRVGVVAAGVIAHNGVATGGGFARILFNTAANFTAPAVTGGIVTLVYDGTDWRG